MQKSMLCCYAKSTNLGSFTNRKLLLVFLFFLILFHSYPVMAASSIMLDSQYSVKSGSFEQDENEILAWEEVQGKPVIKKKASPYYPKTARIQGVSGLVVVEVIIDTMGNVQNAVIHKSIPLLDPAALDAARKFKFTPGEKSDRPVKVRMMIPFNFKLK